MGGDRFIPTRNSKQMDVASFLLSKENEPVDTNNTTGTSVSYCFDTPSKMGGGLLFHSHQKQQMILHSWSFSELKDCIDYIVSLKESQKAWSMSLNGYNIEDAKILHLGGKPLNAPEGNIRICVNHIAWQKYCIHILFTLFLIWSNVQAIKTTWRSSTVRVQPLPLSKRQDTYLQLLTKSWMLLIFEMISVSVKRFFLITLMHVRILFCDNSNVCIIHHILD